MPKVIAVCGTKGGQGKTTLCANLGAFLSSLGKKVLFFDADSQPALSDYYQLEQPIARYGLVDVFKNPSVITQAITKTTIGCDIVLSNDDERNIESELAKSGIHDTIYRLGNALHRNIDSLGYDYVLIDCPGMTSTIHQAAIMAADLIVCPVTPDTMSFREFPRGTLTMIKKIEQNLEEEVVPWPDLAPVHCVVYRKDNTTDAADHEKALAQGLRGVYESLKEQAEDEDLSDAERFEAEKILSNHDFMLSNGFTTCKTAVPQHVVYKAATTNGIPVHAFETSKKFNNARNIMRKITQELPLGLTDSDFNLADAVAEEV